MVKLEKWTHGPIPGMVVSLADFCGWVDYLSHWKKRDTSYFGFMGWATKYYRQTRENARDGEIDTDTYRTGWQMVAILSVKELRRNSLEIEGSSSSASQIWSGLKHAETIKLPGPLGPWDWQQCFYRGGGGRGDLDFKHFGPRRGHRRCVGVGCLAGCDSQEQGSHWKRLWRRFFFIFFSLNKWGWVKTLVPSVHPK